MSTATAPEEQAVDFKQPMVTIGDTVEWYAGGTRSDSPTVATVIKVNANSVNLRLRDESNKLVYGARHVDDPSLEKNDEYRKAGGWDWTFRHRKWEQVMREFSERLAVLERFANTERRKAQ